MRGGGTRRGVVDADLALRVHALLDAQASGKSGALEIRAAGGVTIVYFHAGRAVFAEEGTLGETLGRLLVQQELLTAEEYARVIDYMTERIVDNETMRFGEAAIELGLLSPEEVHAALAEQVKRKIARALRWEGATATFTESAEALEGLARFPCTVEPVVLSVCRAHFDRDRLNDVVAESLMKHLIAPEPAELAERFGATPAELRVVRSLDGSRPLAECVRTHGDDAALPILAALLLCGALEAPRVRAVEEPTRRPVARAEPPTPLAAPTPVARAEPATVPAAAAQSHAHGDDAEHRRRATAAAASLWLGRRIASTADPRRARVEAEQAFHRGRRFVRDGRFDRAEPELRRATDLYPEADEYALYAAFVALRRATDPAARTRMAAALAKRLREALKRDPELAFAHYVDGHLALDAGDVARAERSFRAALRLDPTELDAERQLRLLASRYPKSKR